MRLVEQGEVVLRDIHQLELGVAALLREVIDPPRHGLVARPGRVLPVTIAMRIMSVSL